MIRLPERSSPHPRQEVHIPFMDDPPAENMVFVGVRSHIHVFHKSVHKHCGVNGWRELAPIKRVSPTSSISWFVSDSVNYSSSRISSYQLTLLISQQQTPKDVQSKLISVVILNGKKLFSRPHRIFLIRTFSCKWSHFRTVFTRLILEEKHIARFIYFATWRKVNQNSSSRRRRSLRSYS